MKKLTYLLIGLLTLALILGACSHQYRAKRENIGQEPAVWPFYRGQQASLGAEPTGLFNGSLTVKWEYKSNDKPAGPLTIYWGQVVYPGTRNKIKFLDIQTGRYLGYFKPQGLALSGLVISDSLGYFAVAPPKNKLKCFNLLRKDDVWVQTVKDAANGSIIVKDLLILGSAEGSLSAYGLLDGLPKWRFEADSRFTVPPAYGAGKIFQPGDNGWLYALSADDGTELFRVQLDGPLVAPAAVADLVYVSDIKGRVYALNTDTGDLVWSTTLDGPIWTSPAVADGRLFVGHSGGEMVALDGASGQVLWRFDATDVIKASAVVAGPYVVFGTMSGKLFSLNRADGSLVEQRELNGAVATAPVTDGNHVLVATDKGIVTCFGEL